MTLASNDHYKINVFNEFFVKAEFLDEFIQAQTENVDLVRAEHQGGEMRFFQNRADETSMFVVGRNRNQDELMQHVARIQERGIAEREAHAQDRPTMVRFLQPVNSTNGAYLRQPSGEPYVAYYLFSLTQNAEVETLQQVQAHIELLRAQKETLLADLYKVANDEDPHQYILHEEYESSAAYDALQVSGHYAAQLDCVLEASVDLKAEFSHYELKELNPNR